MPPRLRKPVTFVERYGLWREAQAKAAAQVDRIIKKEKLEVVRFSFADQHGVLRGKTLLASEASHAMRSAHAASWPAGRRPLRAASIQEYRSP